jgi:hypothetical protein
MAVWDPKPDMATLEKARRVLEYHEVDSMGWTEDTVLEKAAELEPWSIASENQCVTRC